MIKFSFFSQKVIQFQMITGESSKTAPLEWWLGQLSLQYSLIIELKEGIGINQKTPAVKILKRPEVSIFDLPLKSLEKRTSLARWLEKDILYDLESDIKYKGYIKRHQNEIKKTAKNERQKIPQKTVFSKIPGLSKEAIEKLEVVKPETLGQASRVSGVSPADISCLFVYLHK